LHDVINDFRKVVTESNAKKD